MGIIMLPILLFYLPLSIMGSFMDFFLPMKWIDKVFFGETGEDVTDADS